MSKPLDALKRKWEEDPLQVIAVGAAAVTSVAMFMNARANLQSRRTWAQEVNRRDRMSYHR